MCSHVALTRKSGHELAGELGAELDPALAGRADLERPRDRVGPGDAHYCLRKTGTQRRLVEGRLGLPSPAQKGLLLNARAETVHRLPAFRDAFVRRRCLIPADAFYEWTGEKGKKIAWRFRRADGGLLLLAALYQEGPFEDDRAPARYAILTTAANEIVGPVHDRMPVIVDPADAETWLHAAEVGFDAKRLLALLRPAAADLLVAEEAGGARRARSSREDEPVPEIPITNPRVAAPEPPPPPAPTPPPPAPAPPPVEAQPAKPRKAKRGEQLSLF